MLKLLITLFSKENKKKSISPDEILEEIRHFLTFEDVFSG